MSEKCTKMSLWSSEAVSGRMKPNPFALLNHLTVPVSRSRAAVEDTARAWAGAARAKRRSMERREKRDERETRSEHD